MKSTNTELEKRIDSILDDMDLSEISKEPLSKSFDSFLDYMNEKVLNEGMNKNACGCELINYLNEYKKSQSLYNEGMHCRVHEWGKIAEDRFSRLLNDEAGMPLEDINLIKKPFHLLLAGTSILQDFYEVFNEFNFDFLIKHKDAKLSANKFFKRLRNNRCPELSALYDSSITSFIKIMGLQLMAASDEDINKRYLERVFIPSMKKEEGFVNEEKVRQEFSSITQLDENMCNTSISAGKRFLARNITDIDSLYSAIKKNYSSLAEYIEKDLGLGAKPFFF